MPESGVLILPSQAHKAPSRPGIYRLLVRLPSNYELGLELDEPSLENALKLIKLKVYRIARAINQRVLVGKLGEEKSHHLRREYRLQAESLTHQWTATLVEEVLEHTDTIDSLRENLSVLRDAFDGLPPVYIGISSERTLYERLQEHLDGMTGVSERMNMFGVGWSDIRFSYNTVDFVSRNDARRLERLVQSIFQPALSSR